MKCIKTIMLVSVLAITCFCAMPTTVYAMDAAANSIAVSSVEKRPVMQLSKTLYFGCGACITVKYTVLNTKITGIQSYHVDMPPTGATSYTVGYTNIGNGQQYNFTIRFTYADGSVHSETQVLYP